VGAARVERPALHIHRVPSRGVAAIAMGMAHRHALSKKGFIPLPFRKTMVKGDARLPERTNGLGVVVDGRARFYPMSALGKPRRLV